MAYISAANKKAWSHRAYEHWVNHYGNPAQIAEAMIADPVKCVSKHLTYLGDVKGKKIANLLGSNGRKAVPLALLGAEVTVVDISVENARYARQLAEDAGVNLTYVIEDIVSFDADSHGLLGSQDGILMEGGIVHYFTDLGILAKVVVDLLKPGGRLVLRDFHPYRKLRSGMNDYFDESLMEWPVAYESFFLEEERSTFPKCKLRLWTIGEIVTSFAAGGLTIERLLEFPSMENERVPGEFVLTAVKPD